jgi:hypothetical protein
MASQSDGVIPLPQIGQELLGCIDKCEKLHGQINSDLAGLMMNGRVALYAGYFSIAHEHFASMLHLLRMQYPASAAALARPHFEACFKGMWVNLKATDLEVDKLFVWKAPDFPTMAVMLDDIDAGYGADGALKMFHMHWKTLCGLTHTGIEQLSRRFSDSGIQSTFTDEDLIKIMTLTASAATAAVVPLLGISGKAQEAQDLQNFHSKIFGWQE